MFAYLFPLISGICTPMQTSVNNRLRDRVHSPYIVSLISFTVATICLVIALLITGEGFSIPFAAISEHPWWIWTGGIFGVLIVVPTTIALPKIGSAKMVMLLSFGQIMTSLIIDHFGMFESLQVKFNITRAIGAVIVIVGVALLAGFKLNSGKTGSGSADCPDSAGGTGGNLLYMLGALISGISCAVQVAINGTLGSVIGNSMKSALMSMTVGAVANGILVLVMLIACRNVLFDAERKKVTLKPWMLLGGVAGFVLVTGNAAAAPIVGAGLVTIMNLVGQMGMSLVIDGVGFLGIEKQAITKEKIIGMLLMIVGAAIITFM